MKWTQTVLTTDTTFVEHLSVFGKGEQKFRQDGLKKLMDFELSKMYNINPTSVVHYTM